MHVKIYLVITPKKESYVHSVAINHYVTILLDFIHIIKHLLKATGQSFPTFWTIYHSNGVSTLFECKTRK